MPDRLVTTEQVNFSGGLDAVSSPHALKDNQVQASTNVDYSLEGGAALCRRGSIQFGTVTGNGTSSLNLALVTRNYGLSTGTWVDAAIPWYTAADSGVSYSGSSTTNPLNFTAISGYSGGGTGQIVPQYTVYEGYVYIANGTSAFKTNGTATYDWLMPKADTPTVTITPQFGASPPFVGFAGTGTSGTFSTSEGTITGSSTSTLYGTAAQIIIETCTTGTGSRIVLVGTCLTTNWEDPTVFITPPTGTGVAFVGGTYTVGGAIDFHQGFPNGDTTGTYTSTLTATQTLTLGAYGTDYILLSLPNQQSVVTIQRDLSIGDATFSNYWHYETTADAINDATIDPVTAYLQSQGNNEASTQSAALNSQRGALGKVASYSPTLIPATRRHINKASVSNTLSPWAVPRSAYQFIGALSGPDFTNIKAVRVIIEFNTTGQSAQVSGVLTYGGIGYPLNDQAGGISYYQTFARVENGLIVAEGAPSDPSPPQRCEFAHSGLVCAANTNTTAGITHRVFYRTGGLLSDAYRVGSCTVASGTNTIYDYALPDMLVISNPIMERFLWSTWPSVSAGTGLPGVNAVSLPWQNRAWIGVQNQLYWSVPGVLSQIQDDTQTTVADNGDNISAIIPAQNLVIVNQNSVFELSGSVFEGVSQDWTLTRTQARRGSAAPRSTVNTPYGILLLGYDGLSLYRQGYGVDQELPWIYERIGDLWKGTAASDPAQIKGRIPSLNQTTIFNSCAAYKDGRIYLAIPCGTETFATRLFVLDMARQTVWLVQYPFAIASLYWDRVANRLVAGTTQGTIQQLETGLVDTSVTGATVGISWSFSTKEWSTATDVLYENLQAEVAGTATWRADIDNTNTFTLGTVVSTVKDWQPVTMTGALGDNINFLINGTQSGTQQGLYSLEWDSIPEQKQVTFYQTDPVAIPSENYVKTWMADLNPLNGTVTGSVLVDGTVVQTATFNSGLTGDINKRKVFEIGLPNVTYGKNVNAQYNGGAFRHYATEWELEPKPFGKKTWLVTYKKAGGVTQADMGRFYAMDIEGSATSTITSTWIIDGSVFSTDTLVFGSSDSGEETGRVRNYKDIIPFPPGARGYLFQQECQATSDFKVWRASLDIDRIGIKGLSRVTMNGTPQ